ncbi:hypothetical protein GY21_13490 [Cryobacterium roopkundense]|nr:hypothetical protein GY21_13490 [Cryobacterium roopkundense]
MSPPGPLDALRVVAHPLRLRLLSLLTGESLSASEAARALGETQANVCYHLRRLAQAGLVDLVEETRVRGGAAKRYRHNPLSGSTLVAGADDATTALLGTLSGELARRSTLATGAQLAFTDAEVWVSPDAWARIQSLARELGTLVHDEARARDAGLIHLGATLAVFPMRATTAMS